MKKLSITRIVIASLLIVVSLAAMFYFKPKAAVTDAGLNPLNLEENIIAPVFLLDKDGNKVQQQAIFKVDGAKQYQKNGDYIYIFKKADDTSKEPVLYTRVMVEVKKVWVYQVKDGKYAYATLTYDKSGNGTIGKDVNFFADDEVAPVYEYDENGDPVYAYATTEGGVYKYDTQSPWTAGAKNLAGNLVADDSILGQSFTIKDPYTGEDFAFSVPSTLPTKAWADLTDDEKETFNGNAEQKKLAVGLYFLANKYYVEADYSGFYSNCLTQNVAVGMNNMIDLNIFELRSQAEGAYYRQDFRVERNIPLTASFSLDTLVGFGLELTCGERRYFDKTMDKTIYNRTQTAKITTAENDLGFAVGLGAYGTNWNALTSSKIASDVYRVQPTSDVYFAEEKTNAVVADDKYTLYGYTKCAHVVNLESVAYAYVYRDASTNLIKVHIGLDLWNGENSIAIQTTVKGIQEGSGDKNAVYTIIDLDFELWQNGYYKTWNQYEYWVGKAVGKFDLYSIFDYYEVFVYGQNNVPIASFINQWDDENWADAKAKYAAL